ncbi:ASCH domain-containing protein [Acinetobacter nosocomialis]|uniref:ASCH domain-containing protein n=1 Tax=Acinetobacter nosocomialis TaxID=106654 RepID=UPI001FD717AF|nr:ASCH domain-containing protein [Acinetobacter nosocomialis]MDO7431689.1 ASCH domain-containing protein [Acinetobacter baumannii]
MQQFLALSVVAPNGTYIAQGVKTLEVRSWVPTELPLKDLLIVENKNFLMNDGDEEEGIAVALVDVVSIHVWQNDEIEPACATSWSEGYFAWVLSNVRPVKQQLKVQAKRKIYQVSMDLP